MTPSEYWVSGSGSIGQRVLHVDQGCPQLKRAEEDREATETEIEECDVCKVCRGDRPRPPPDFSYQRALEEASSQHFMNPAHPIHCGSRAGPSGQLL